MQPRIEVVILGATVMVGQHFIKFLQGHPWFDLVWLGASDRYELLAHRAGVQVNAAAPGDTVVYDSQAAGILDPQPSGYWAGKYPATDLAQDPTVVLPDLGPDTLAHAALVPQDSHFALNFAHPVADIVAVDGQDLAGSWHRLRYRRKGIGPIR